MSEDNRVADYFVISGLSPSTNFGNESRKLVNATLPITDIALIFRKLDEKCPDGYTCIETTPEGHVADLNNGNYLSSNIRICYRRGLDKPPLIEVGVYHEDSERLLSDNEIIYQTPYGHSASTGNIGSKCGTYITYKRAKTKYPYNQMVVVDLCVILNNKSEHPPHAFYSIKKNLNKSYYGMIGSEVFLCYKKTILTPPSICYTPQIVSRFPLQDYPNFSLPDTVPLFCLPTGASIEARPADMPPCKPEKLKFVLTSDSAKKFYGTAITFYEPFDKSQLTVQQKERLGIFDVDLQDYNQDDQPNTNQTVGRSKPAVVQYETYAIKAICILSQWPFFECFEKFLLFLHRLVFNCRDSKASRARVPLEHYISHFLLDVSFPTPERPTTVVQLMPGLDEAIEICQPSSQVPLPCSGAAFHHLLLRLGVDNTMNVLLFGLSEQKILLHSLNPWLLTAVAEALNAILFPFHWQCPYVPLCPLSLHGILNAPLPFIVGIDSRCFDTFSPPEDVICIDLDTEAIYLSEMKKCLNLKLLPKRAARVLRGSLDKIYLKLTRLEALTVNQSPRHQGVAELTRAQRDKKIDLEIQEAFIRFMVTILRGFRTYLLPITRAPTIGATDPTSLFDFEGFLSSRDRNYTQFYQLITKTQMFTHYIEERSFLSDKGTSLAFFDDCEEKLTSSDDIFSARPIKLFNTDDNLVRNDRSVFIPAPEQSPLISTSITSNLICDLELDENATKVELPVTPKFGPLNSALFHRHPQLSVFSSLDRAPKSQTSTCGNILINGNPNNPALFSISRRTKQEVRVAQKLAKKSVDSPSEWSRYLLSCCHSLWFSTLPAYIVYCKAQNNKTNTNENHPDLEDKCVARILRFAFSLIAKMQKLQINTDEICFRVLTLLCGHYGQPALAVRVFFEMKKAGIKPNAVTYGYYNKAVLEGHWPDNQRKATTVMWTKIRNVIIGITHFKFQGKLRSQRLQTANSSLRYLDTSYNPTDIDDIEHEKMYALFGHCVDHSTLPIPRVIDTYDHSHNTYKTPHRRSLVNRSFSNYLDKSENNLIKTCDTDLTGAPKRQETGAPKPAWIHKSYSMHLRHSSPERSAYNKRNSSSFDDENDDDDEPNNRVDTANVHEEQLENSNYQKQFTSTRRCTIEHWDLYNKHKEQNELLCLTDDEASFNHISNINQIHTDAGVLFVGEPEFSMSSALSLNWGSRWDSVQLPTRDLESHYADSKTPHSNSNSQPSSFLRESSLRTDTPIMDADRYLKTNSFGEDTQILKKIEMCDQRAILDDSTNCIASSEVGGDDISSEDACRDSNKLSESTAEPSESGISRDDDMKNPEAGHFKLAALINDASNLQWSKWTSSQNSKSVYKGIKSAATGLVSSIQELKSSFSISNSNTPAKPISAQQHKSINTTREVLSQWATYFTSGSARTRDDDSDGSSIGSNDLLRLSNDQDINLSASANINDYRLWRHFFDLMDKHYGLIMRDGLLNHLSQSDLSANNTAKPAIEIKITTCSRCNVCHSLLYDEEIMEKWSHNESNLNTRCIYCRAKILPLMTILVNDNRFPTPESGSTSDTKTEKRQQKESSEALLVDFETSSNPDQIESDIDNSTTDQQALRDTKDHQQATNSAQQLSFTVPYLSPIVLRKELESVYESSGDSCPADSRFVDEHPIIFWNLLWYFSRINAPTHLAMLCLKAKAILNNREIPQEWIGDTHKVIVTTLWDNEKLHAGMGKPLYRLYERAEPSKQVRAILCDELYFKASFLDLVVGLIKIGQLHMAMSEVLSARLKSMTRFSFDKNRHNLYRDLMFLVIKQVGPGRFNSDNFEREYKRAFESLNFQQVALNRFDRPPTLGSLFCRKCFKELELEIGPS